jgi:DNA-binding transcriptional regulator YiaG
MAKKHLYYNEAERLYVAENMTIAEIANRLNLGEKTVRLWKEEGDWERKKLQFIKEKQSFAEELFVFARKLAKTIMEDWEKGEKVDPGRLYALTRLIPLVIKTKDFESALESAKKDEINIEEVIKQALSSALGET